MLSSIFVASKEKDYGTRSQAVLLIDHENNITFVEKAKQIPSLKLENHVSQNVTSNY